jgi:cellulose synthase/poly-beta-1,6-N-acetylglucosamine synthase-like glycosyltransferase
MELVVRLHKHCMDKGIAYRIQFVPDPVAWTECPESLRELSRQRDRWQRGLAQVLTRHWRMLLQPRYGKVGLLAYPYFYFLEMSGPAIELLGYVSFAVSAALGLVDGRVVVAFLTLAFLFGMMLSVASVTLEELTSADISGPGTSCGSSCSRWWRTSATASSPPCGGSVG